LRTCFYILLAELKRDLSCWTYYNLGNIDFSKKKSFFHLPWITSWNRLLIWIYGWIDFWTSEFSFVITCYMSFWVLFHFLSKYWSILILLGLIWGELIWSTQKDYTLKFMFSPSEFKKEFFSCKTITLLNTVFSATQSHPFFIDF
jgi:hypothetical protein